jgi:hypothetical protein
MGEYKENGFVWKYSGKDGKNLDLYNAKTGDLAARIMVDRDFRDRIFGLSRVLLDPRILKFTDLTQRISGLFERKDEAGNLSDERATEEIIIRDGGDLLSIWEGLFLDTSTPAVNTSDFKGEPKIYSFVPHPPNVRANLEKLRDATKSREKLGRSIFSYGSDRLMRSFRSKN